MASVLVRTALIGAALTALALMSAGASGWEYSTPWCARMATGVDDCAYYTVEQCRATVSGEGGTCVVNPRYTPHETVRPRPRRIPPIRK